MPTSCRLPAEPSALATDRGTTSEGFDGRFLAVALIALGRQLAGV